MSFFVPQHEVRNDFNGDGRSDFLLRDESAGWLSNWLGTANGSLNINIAGTNYLPLDWDVVGAGDFNGDGRSDFLVRSEAGEINLYVGNANGNLSNRSISSGLGAEWRFTGTGDFNRDGFDDFLLRREDGWMTEWLGNSFSFTQNGAAALYFTTDWNIVSTGDFNGDGYSDILLRSDEGWVTNWLGTANGSFTNNGANTSLFFTPDWKVVGTGDVNGDGKDDLVLRRDDGWITDWLATDSGSFISNGANAATFLGTDWKIASIADFNGDGREDLLLRQDSGWITNWLGSATGGFTNNGANFSTFIAPNWVVQDPFM